MKSASRKHKTGTPLRLFLFFLCMLLCLSLPPITAFAADDDEGGTDVSDPGEGEEDRPSDAELILGNIWGTEDDNKLNTNDYDAMLDEFVHSANAGFALVKLSIKQSSNGLYYFSTQSLTQQLLNIFTPLGFLVMMVCWCVSLAKKAVNLDLFGGKELVASCMSLIAGMIFITLTDQILLLIMGMADGVSGNVLAISHESADIMAHNYFKPISVFWQFIPIIGPLMQLINGITLQVPALLNSILLSLVAIIVNVQINIRLIKLTVFRGIAPVFFGMLSGEQTKKYFESFVLEFLTVALQLVMMAVFFVMYEITYARLMNSSLWPQFDGFNMVAFTMSGIVMLTFLILCIKSDSFLRKILHR